jgi:nucleotide sugar dehydrogenase
MKIGVIGAGRLGITFALLCEKAGYDVIVSDIRQEYIEKLNNKTIDTAEPEVLLMLQKSKNLKATQKNSEVISESDVIYTFVQTPSLPSGEYDITYLMEVVEDFEKFENHQQEIQNKLFVIGCTTNPGDTKTIEEKLEPLSVIVAYNPEFIAQGEIVKGLEYADLVLVGTENLETINILKQIYEKIQKTDVKMCPMSPTAAEITKIGINCFLTTKISYANMIGEILVSSKLHNEVDKVLDTIGKDSRIGHKYLNYGFGFGGPCLPRDNRALGNYAKKVGLETNLPYTIDNFNLEHSNFLKSYFIGQNPNKEIPFVFNYISYKKGTDMLVESQQLKLAKDLLDEGYSVNIIEEDSILNNSQFINEIESDYPNQVKFYKLGSNPKGFKINMN